MSTTASAAGSTGETRAYRDYGRPLWRRVLLSREAAVIALLILVWIVGYTQVPHFAAPITLTFLLQDMAPVLLIALPMTLIIITGEIDLSVASVMGLSSALIGILTQQGWAFGAAFLVALIVGLVAGLVNGVLVTVVGLPSLAVTIGTLALYRGIAQGLLGSKAITDFPSEWTSLATGNIPGTPLPIVTVLIVVLALVFGLLLHFTPFGRGVYAIGLSADAAAFSGVRITRTKIILFALAGLVSAVAGAYYTLRFGSARGDNATGLELSVVAAVLLGGVSIFGGRGALPGVLAGALLIGAIASALRLAGITSDVINVVTGVLLVLSVVIAGLLGKLRFRRLRIVKS
ncbi:ABC transporter permease [Schumannella soli]|uniref:Autoinducer 2 import system permease protein LsrD n=1 Tax=Schumannella soli TaxID=2590779 RepID=A0A506XNC3_9MICO|nr:ABC transporter permease [Schumannella soli]TPW74154.1 ABC transporter permease [Schumannella soli]